MNTPKWLQDNNVSSSIQPQRGSKFEIIKEGLGAALKYNLAPNEEILSDSDAMMVMSPSVEMQATTGGGFLKALGRKLLTGETLVQTKYTARGQNDFVILSPQFLGDIVHIPMNGNPMKVQKGSYLASSAGVTMSTKMQSLSKAFFSKEGFFISEATGQGDLFVCSYGAIIPIELSAGERVKVDNGHLVAWDSNMPYSLTKATGSIMASILTGECIVCEFTGPGKIYIQTRNLNVFDGHVINLVERFSHE